MIAGMHDLSATEFLAVTLIAGISGASVLFFLGLALLALRERRGRR